MYLKKNLKYSLLPSYKLAFIAFIILICHSFQIEARYKTAVKIYQNKKKGELSSRDDLAIARELIKSKYYYSAVHFVKEYLVKTKTLDPTLEPILEKLVLKTGPLSFSYLDDKILLKLPSHSLHFVYGLKNFRKKQYKRAIKALRNFPEDHRLAPESQLILGSAYHLAGQLNKATGHYQQCQTLAKKNASGSGEHKKLRQYFTIIKESCLIHTARMAYRSQNYKKALSLYEKIPKTSFRWPYILIEKSWVHFMLKDYNRSLGTLVTYKSPLLKSYFFPEAEYLTALSYFNLCLWQDSKQVINHYYSTYKPRSEKLKSFLIKHKSSHTYFLKTLLGPISKREHLGPYMRNLMTQVRKKIKFNLDLINYKKLQNELRHLQKGSKDPLTLLLKAEMKRTLSWRTKHLNHYIKKQMFSFINDIHRFSYEQFNIQLEVMALKRELVYDNKQLISNRSRGDLQNVSRRAKQHFYGFRGEFWADELGDYSFGLKSNCKKVKNKKK